MESDAQRITFLILINLLTGLSRRKIHNHIKNEKIHLPTVIRHTVTC